MKLTHKDYELIRYLFVDVEWSPLEIAEELGFTFKQICDHIDKDAGSVSITFGDVQMLHVSISPMVTV